MENKIEFEPVTWDAIDDAYFKEQEEIKNLISDRVIQILDNTEDSICFTIPDNDEKNLYYSHYLFLFGEIDRCLYNEETDTCGMKFSGTVVELYEDSDIVAAKSYVPDFIDDKPDGFNIACYCGYKKHKDPNNVYKYQSIEELFKDAWEKEMHLSPEIYKAISDSRMKGQ